MTQKQAVLQHLMANEGITSMEAFNLYGVTRLSAIIFELRRLWEIDTIDCHGKNRFGQHCNYAQYRLVKKDED